MNIKVITRPTKSGHGKSACDGIGAVAKSSASDAINQGKVTIQDANDFFAWANSGNSIVRYQYYSSEEYETASNMAVGTHIKGTFELHAIRSDMNGGVVWQNTSCYNLNLEGFPVIGSLVS